MLRLLLTIGLLFATASDALAGDPVAGRKRAVPCFACHGRNGIATLAEAPNLAGQNEFYLIKALKEFRDGTRKNDMMTAMTQSLQDEDIANLAAYYSGIQISVQP